ncbi:MAG: ATP-binding protein [Planctomycetota bacterium]|jgi:signal transduction histidine kinase
MRTVCLADESAARRQEIQSHLQTRGFEVRAYADGMSAWQGVLAGGHELCIISHELPDLSGFDLLSLISGASLAVPTIFMTASGSEQLAADTLNLGATCYLVKGSTERLLGALDSALARACRELDLEEENRRLIAGLEAKVEEKTRSLSDALVRLSTLNQELKSLDRMKSTFIALMSHEIRTPLTSILGFAELISHGFCEDRSEQESLAEQIRTSGREIQTFVDDLMELFQWLSSSIDPVVSPVRLESVVRTAQDLVAEPSESRQVSIRVESRGDSRIEGDESILVRVLQRVLDNAVKFSHAGGEILIRIEGRGDRCALEVIDHGVGVDRSRRDAIFRPLEIAGDLGNHSKGSGLGLSLAHQAVRSHGGTIRLDSEGEGHGATVRIELPRVFGRLLPGARPDPEISPQSLILGDAS